MELGLSVSLSNARRTGLSAALDLIFNKASAFDSRVVATRTDPNGSCASYWDSDGVLKFMGMNLIPNSACVGASMPSTLPTGWSLGSPGYTGLSYSVVGTGVTSNGNPYVDIRINGTSTSGGTLSIRPDTTYKTVAPSSTYTASINVALIAGTNPSAAALGFDFSIGGAYAGTVTAAAAAPTSTLTQAKTTGAVSASANQISSVYFYYTALTASQAVDVTLRLSAPQLEFGSTVNTFSPTYGTANSGPRINHDPSQPIGGNGVEIATNFQNATGWGTGGSGFTVANGQVTITNSPQNSWVQFGSLSVGKQYFVKFTVSGLTNGPVAILPAGGAGISASTNGNYSGYITPNANGQGFYIWQSGASNTSCVISNVTVQEATFAPRSWLMEETRTNLLTGNFWSNNGNGSSATSTQNAIGPDGLATSAWTVTESLTSAYQYSISAGGNLTSAVHTASAFVKAGTANKCQLFVNALLSGDYVNFSLTGTGSITAATTPANCSITLLANGWYRVTMQFTATAGSGGVLISHIATATDTRNPATNTGTGRTLFVYGAQIELGATASSFILPTTTTAATTRGTDSGLMSGTGFTSWFPSGNAIGTLVCEFDTAAKDADARAVCLFNSGDSNTVSIRKLTSNALSMVNRLGATNNDITSIPGSNTINNVIKMAVSFNSTAGTAQASYNGGCICTGVFPVINNFDHMNIGIASANSGSINGHIKRITYYPQEFKGAALQNLAAPVIPVPDMLLDFVNNTYYS